MTKPKRTVGPSGKGKRFQEETDAVPPAVTVTPQREEVKLGIDLSRRYLSDFSLLFAGNQLLLPPQGPGESREGLAILIRGCPGAGKTTVALQFAGYLARQIATGNNDLLENPSNPSAPRGVYKSLEQEPWSLRQRLAGIIFNQMGHAKDMQESVKEVSSFWLPKCDMASSLSKDIESRTRGETASSIMESAKAVGEEPDKTSDLPLVFSLGDARDEETSSVFSESVTRALNVMSFILSGTQTPKTGGFQWPVLTLDGLSVLPDEHRYVVTLDRLVERMKQLAAVSILVYDPVDAKEADNLDHKVDLVIELREHEIQSNVRYVTNELCIHKSRYQNAAKGWHQYKLREYGIETYPSIHFQVHQPNYMPSHFAKSLSPIAVPTMRRATAGRMSVLEGILGPIRDGSTVALLGGRGCFKTELTFDFLMAGASSETGNTPEPGLLLSLIDNMENLRTGIVCPRDKCCERRRDDGDKACEECRNNLFLFHQRPGCITAAEFIYYVKKRLDHASHAGRIRRLVFWDLTQIDHRFPMLTDDRVFLPALMDLVKFNPYLTVGATPVSGNARSLKTVFMGAGNAGYTKAISAMADNVVYCWRDRVKDGYSADAVFERKKAKDAVTLLESEYGKKVTGDLLVVHVDRREIRSPNLRSSLFAVPVISGVLALPHYSAKMSAFSVSRESQARLHMAAEMLESIAADQGVQRIVPRQISERAGDIPSGRQCGAPQVNRELKDRQS